MKRLSKKRRLALLILCAILLLGASFCFLKTRSLSRLLPSQYAAERWQGEGETKFSQISCFLPPDEAVDLNKIYGFRYALLDKLHEAGFEADTDTRLFRDAWSVAGKENVTSELGKGEASVLAVGGNYFDFHPIRLLNGSYLAEEDLMQDRVLLDEELAWMLFGGTDLQGQELKIASQPFVVAGVIQREQDFASRLAYSNGPGLYMSFDAYRLLHEEAKADCYELVLAEPVDDFSLSVVKEKFPIGKGEIVENSGRFTFSRLLQIIGQYGKRSMQTHGVLYPYWENAARAVEDWSALYLLLGLILVFLPAALLLFQTGRLIWRGKKKVTEDVFPRMKDKAERVIQKQQRRRWEKKHKEM